ncbi:hypothetical protein ACOSP6_10310 [Tenacibaculum sp. MEBiC06402]|uniref:hypothetical protein n=1 Tax=unclassified Tenacibaculum TaxID=2635139 RepID=UPI003B9D9795
MIGIILLVFIGKTFYKLAENYEKNKWGIAFLGVGAYFLATFLFGVILAVILIANDSNWLETTNRFSLALIEVPIGGLSCYLLYMFLEKKWENEKPEIDDTIDQIGNKE